MSNQLPTPDKLSVPYSMVRDHFRGAIANGVAPEMILQRARVALKNPDDLQQRLPLQQFGQIVKSTFEVLQDEASGFLLRPLKPGTFALMCHATITCPNLRRALLRSARFFNVVSDEIVYSLTEQGEEAIFGINLVNSRPLDQRFLVFSLFITSIRWSSWLIDKPLLLERINFAFPAPDYQDELHEIFPCRHYFNQPSNTVVFNTRFLEMTVARDTQALTDFLAHAPERLLTHYRSDNSLTTTIRNMLQGSNSVEVFTFETVAERLHMTTQTLRRRLKEEGNTYQEIKDSARRATAIYHLSHLDTPINDIAAMMGFSEASAFNRAFKRWTGCTPGSYRENHRQQKSSANQASNV